MATQILTRTLVFGFLAIFCKLGHAQEIKNQFVGFRVGPSFLPSHAVFSDLESLSPNTTTNAKMEVFGKFQLIENFYLNGAIGLLSYSTSLSFGDFVDKRNLGLIPNIQVGADYFFVNPSKLTPYLGINLMGAIRPNWKSYTIDSQEGIKLMPSPEGSDLLVESASVNHSDAPFILHIVPEIGIQYAIAKKTSLLLSYSFGWNVSQKITEVNYNRLTFNGQVHQLQYYYTGNFSAIQLGLAFLLK